MTRPLSYDVAVVGGGPAGLTTALYTTRLGHATAVFEQAGGRHATVQNVHNLLGVSEDVSGSELAELGVRQLEEYGADFHPDSVTEVTRTNGHDGNDGDDDTIDDGFRVETTHATVEAEAVVFATGFTDRGPGVAGLEQFTGRGLHYCLHCDAYTLGDGSVYVLGRNDHAAEVAMLLLNVTDDVDLLLDGDDPAWDDDTARQVAAHPVELVETEVVGTFTENERAEPIGGRPTTEQPTGGGDAPWLGGLTFADGTEREYAGGFAVYGTEYNSELAADLGCDCRDDGAIAVDDRGETSVEGVYAVGDVTHGQNQTPVALGDGARTGIAVHKDLRRYPVPADELDEDADLDDLGLPDDHPLPGAPADLRARMRRDRTRDEHAGLREPRPER